MASSPPGTSPIPSTSRPSPPPAWAARPPSTPNGGCRRRACIDACRARRSARRRVLTADERGRISIQFLSAFIRVHLRLIEPSHSDCGSRLIHLPQSVNQRQRRALIEVLAEDALGTVGVALRERGEDLAVLGERTLARVAPDAAVFRFAVDQRQGGPVV